MKILIIVLSEKREGYYVKMEQSIRQTWGAKALEHESIVDVLYTYGQWDRDLKGEVERHGDKLDINHREDYFKTSGKSVKTLKYVHENFEFDYVFRTNLSSYIHVDKLVEYVQDKPRENFYHGILAGHPHKKDVTFVSGAGFFLSKDVVQLVAENIGQIELNTIDDIGLAAFLHNKVEPTKGRRLDLLGQFKNWQGVKDDTHYHYRVHTTEGTRPVHERRLDDCQKIEAIHKHFYPNEK